MIDKFKVLNKVKIDTNKYIEIENHNSENLKIKMEEKLKSSKRTKKKTQKINLLTSTIASISVIIIVIGIMNPSLADNIIKNLPQFETMLDKIKESLSDEDTVEYNPELHPEIEEAKRQNIKNKLVATPINVSSKSNGLEMTINKAMYNKKNLYLDITLKTDEKFKESKLMKAVSDSPYGDGEKNMNLDIFELYINSIKADSYGWNPAVVEFVDDHTINLSYLLEFYTPNDIRNANFKLNFGIPISKEPFSSKKSDGEWSFNFNIKAVDDDNKHIDVNKKDGEYTLKSVDISNTYVEIKMGLPFQPSLGNPHNNFIIVKDQKGRELELSSGIDGDNKIYTQINELIKVGEIPEYIDVFIYPEDLTKSPLHSFRVEIPEDYR